MTEVLQTIAFAVVLACMFAMLLACPKTRRRRDDLAQDLLSCRLAMGLRRETPAEHKLRLEKAARFGAIFRLALVRTVLGIIVALGPVSIAFLMCRLVAPKQFVEMGVAVYVAMAGAAVLIMLAAWCTSAAQAPPPVRPFVRRRDTCPIPPAKPAASEQRAYSERLIQFLHDSSPTKPATVPERSRMAFFANFIPGRRHLPKSAAAIREILWRIRRRLQGGA